MSENELLLQQIGKRIIERRKKLGLTQEALAEKGDMTTQFVSYAESGKRAMRPENLLKISSALGVSADYILTGIGKAKDCREAERKRSLIRTNGARQQFKRFCLSRNTAVM